MACQSKYEPLSAPPVHSRSNCQGGWLFSALNTRRNTYDSRRTSSQQLVTLNGWFQLPFASLSSGNMGGASQMDCIPHRWCSWLHRPMNRFANGIAGSKTTKLFLSTIRTSSMMRQILKIKAVKSIIWRHTWAGNTIAPPGVTQVSSFMGRLSFTQKIKVLSFLLMKQLSESHKSHTHAGVTWLDDVLPHPLPPIPSLCEQIIAEIITPASKGYSTRLTQTWVWKIEDFLKVSTHIPKMFLHVTCTRTSGPDWRYFGGNPTRHKKIYFPTTYVSACSE